MTSGAAPHWHQEAGLGQIPGLDQRGFPAREPWVQEGREKEVLVR